jgi:hypothetical protein
MHSVNATSDAFGNGIFDGCSIVTGHEYSEAVTDPDNFFAVQDGWNDATTIENGDKFAWYHIQNITLAGHQFAPVDRISSGLSEASEYGSRCGAVDPPVRPLASSRWLRGGRTKSVPNWCW